MLRQAGLFSAVVAIFISLSIQDIRANPQDTSNFYLAGIHQALTGSNLSDFSFPSSPPPFTPPTFGIWVNSLWFMSLAVNLTCAVLANLLQQWARKYLKFTQPSFNASEPRRARYRAFYADGAENFFLPLVFEALPAMLHLSVFLFFSGLVVFLWNFNSTVSKLILSWVASCVTLYGYITFIPTFRHDSPYNTPLSPLAWRIVTGVPFISLRVLEWVSYFLNVILGILSFIRHCLIILLCPILFVLFFFLACCFDLKSFEFISMEFGIDLDRVAEAGDRRRKLFVQGMKKTVEKAGLSLQSLSGHAFMWAFDGSQEDKDLERLFANLPGFRKSNDDEDFFRKLTRGQKENLWSGLVRFLDRTFSSDSLPEDDKSRRATICAEALKVDPEVFTYILESVTSKDLGAPVQSVELAPFIRDNSKDLGDLNLTRQAIVSCVVATAQQHNAKWFTIASDELGVEKSVYQNYTESDLSLAILIHITCQQLHHFNDASWQREKFCRVLQAASKFKVQEASRELKNGFCSLWNQIILKMKVDRLREGDDPKIERLILRPLYKVYANIHQPSSPTTSSARTSEDTGILKHPCRYPSCTNVTHLLDMTNLVPHGNDNTTLITFASIMALPQPTSETTHPLTLVTVAPGASSVISLTTGPSTAGEDDSKSEPSLCDDVDTPSVNRAHLAITTNSRLSSPPSVTDSKEADAAGSLETNVEGTGDHTPPTSHHEDDIV